MFLLPQAYVSLAEFGYPIYAFWFYCFQNITYFQYRHVDRTRWRLLQKCVERTKSLICFPIWFPMFFLSNSIVIASITSYLYFNRYLCITRGSSIQSPEQKKKGLYNCKIELTTDGDFKLTLVYCCTILLFCWTNENILLNQ